MDIETKDEIRLTAVVKGLEPGTTYDFRIRAVASSGDEDGEPAYSDPSKPVTARTNADAPDAPGNLGLTPFRDRIEVSWEAPADDRGSAVTRYTVEWTEAADTSWSSPSSHDVTDTSYTITGLADDTAYAVRVRAVNDVDAGDWSAPVETATLPIVEPGAPVNLQLEPVRGGLGVSWEAPADDGGSPVTRYRVEWTNEPDTTTQDPDDWDWSSASFHDVTDPAVTSHTITGLENGTAYAVRVRAVNVVGDGDWAEDEATPLDDGLHDRVARSVLARVGRDILDGTVEAVSGRVAAMDPGGTAPASVSVTLAGHTATPAAADATAPDWLAGHGAAAPGAAGGQSAREVLGRTGFWPRPEPLARRRGALAATAACRAGAMAWSGRATCTGCALALTAGRIRSGWRGWRCPGRMAGSTGARMRRAAGSTCP